MGHKDFGKRSRIELNIDAENLQCKIPDRYPPSLLFLWSWEVGREALAEDLRQVRSRSILPVDLDPEVPVQRLRPRFSPQEIFQEHHAVLHVAP